MKKSLLTLSTIIFLAILFYPQANVTSMSTGSPGGMSGAPGDNTCVQCHSSFGLNSGTAIVNITSNIPVSGYMPGNTYTITASAAQTGISKYGFEIHESLGTILITNATTTKHVGVGSNRITHEAAGTTVIINSISWNFDWVAPATGSGDATFYGAFVAANDGTGNNNDHVYTSNMVVSEFITTPGCMDTLACNYDPTATQDDGSCVYQTASTSSDTACDSYTWNGINYTSSGTYDTTFAGGNAVGCDSTATINLTINYSTVDSVTVVACDSYTWSVNGITYYSSISDTVLGTNAAGCLETNILHLTINYSTIDTLVVVACDSYTWNVNGVIYNSSVIDTVIGVNSAGCIETNILHLTVNNGGCTDSLASNYDSLATCNNGTCTYPLVYENLFFSEYAEGSSDNKYFEIFNPTNDTISLANYAFARVNNSPNNGLGIYEYWNDFDSGAVILPMDVFIVAHPNADSLILVQSDMQFGSMSNGNDGFAIVYGSEPASPILPDGISYAVLDRIGSWNGDYTNNPGSSNDGWDVAGVAVATANHTLVRKCPISKGDTSWINAAGTDPVNSQWIVLVNNDWTNIGFHNTCICDSSTNSYASIFDTICNGLSIVVGNSTYDSTGVYLDTLLALNGCDSIITTNLTVLSSSVSNVLNDVTICDGDSIVVGSSVYNLTGSYTDILVNSAGCDSIITTNLTIQTPVYHNITICDGDSIVVGNSVYNSTGSYTDTIQSSIGCDSIVHTNLTIYSQFNSIFGGIPNNTVGGGSYYSGQQSLELSCYMPSELVSAVIYSADTTLTTFEIRDDNGIVLDDTTVNVIPGGHRVYFNYNMSAGSYYELGVNGGSNDLFRNNSGVNYPYNFGSLAAVTSSSAGGNYYYFFYDIEVKQSSQPTHYSICDGDSITVAGNVYSVTGFYTDSLISSIGCDSLVFTNLVVHPNVSLTNNQTICSGEIFVINGNIYDSTGIYIDSLHTLHGCDSVVTTHLTVLTISAGTGVNNQTICIGDSIFVGNHVYYHAGVYHDTLISSNGCDSVVTTTLTVQTANYASINGGILDTTIGGGGFFSGSQYLELSCYEPSMLVSAVVYAQDTTLTIFEIRDDNGNVLSDTTYQLIPGGNRIYFNYEMTVGLDYELGINGASNNLYRNNAGVNYSYDFGTAASITSSSAGGNYYYFFYDVEVLPYLYEYNELYICDGDSIIVGGNVYNTPGQYMDTFVANNFCDSVVFTVLDFYQSPPLHIGSVPNPPEICLGDTILLEASPGFVYYTWTNGMTGYLIYDTPIIDTWYTVSAKDSNGCWVKEDINVYVDSCITGINEISITEELKVYPNPTSKQITFEFTGKVKSIKVFNILGELIVEQQITEGQQIVQLVVDSWQAANYSVQLQREDGSIVHKVFTVVR